MIVIFRGPQIFRATNIILKMVNLSVFLKRPLNTMVKNKLPLGLFLRQVEIFKLTHKF